MIRPEFFYNTLKGLGIDFYTGVPDSLLKNICAYITDNADRRNNIIAANEGGAIGLAAGYHIATGRIPVVYMQNSGIGNAVNPLMSLTDSDVYRIPVLLVIGWRGEPGVHDEPQHVKQGKTTLPLLEAMGIRHEVMCGDEAELGRQLAGAAEYMRTTGEAFALVVKKGSFDKYKLRNGTHNPYTMEREEAIKTVAEAMGKRDIVVSTTGKISRELFEHRTATGEGHSRDFLTVGSMGHASQIALGIAINHPGRNVYCFDGDGATIMHMGSMGIVADMAPRNYYHIIFNNGAHDSVGGQPTIGFGLDLTKIAGGCGYKTVMSVSTREELDGILPTLTQREAPLLLEIKVKKGSREDLGRPTTTPVENKEALMRILNDE